jgi:hypothetical protein
MTNKEMQAKIRAINKRREERNPIVAACRLALHYADRCDGLSGSARDEYIYTLYSYFRRRNERLAKRGLSDTTAKNPLPPVIPPDRMIAGNLSNDGGPGSGRYPKGSGGKDENSFEPEGENPSIPGFAKKRNLNKHYADHGKQYPGLTKQQYQQKALDLVRSPVGGDVIGYKSRDGAIVRYNTATNDFVKAYSTGIATMYKPDDGLAYYERDKKKKG